MCKTILFAGTILFSFADCSMDHKPHKDPIIGTWKGTASYKQISEFKVYAPLLEDSLTQLTGSMIVIPDVVMNIAREEVRFWNMQSISTSIYVYEREKNNLNFQKKTDHTGSTKNKTSGVHTITAISLADSPSAIITKLDADSLVLQLTVYGDGWNDYTLRLKRK
jgi:hypothetical protein